MSKARKDGDLNHLPGVGEFWLPPVRSTINSEVGTSDADLYYPRIGSQEVPQRGTEPPPAVRGG